MSEHDAHALHLLRQVVVVAAVMVMGGFPPQIVVAPAHATFPGGNGRIAVQFPDFDCNEHIITMRPNGTDPRRLSGSECGRRAVRTLWNWSPRGERLLVGGMIGPTDRETLLLMAEDGRITRRLWTMPFGLHDSVGYAPDGRRIVYGSRGEIWTAQLDGSDKRRLGRGHHPRWSPDGRTIAYEDWSVTRGGIWLMDARTGTPLRQLTRDPSDADVGAWLLDWAPDGASLLVAKDWDYRDDLYELSTSGLDAVRPVRATRKVSEGAAVFSPDGRSIAFVTKRADRRFRIYVKAREGGRSRRIWTGPAPILDSDDGEHEWPTVAWQPRP